MTETTESRASAREILAQRFARGEISAEEYRERLAALSDSASSDKAPPSRSDDGLGEVIAGLRRQFQSPNRTKVYQKALAALGVITIIAFAASSGAGDSTLHVRNLHAAGLFGDIVSGQVLNEGPSGDVYLWIELNGDIYCPRKTYLREGEYQRFEIRCYDMPVYTGTFQAIATRRPPASIRDSARSL